MLPTRLLLHLAHTFPCKTLLAITLGVATNTCYASVSPGTTEPAHKQFALTLNPLNLLIGRYGFDFQYEPTPHHAVIATPHYDYVSGDVGTDGCSGMCSLKLNGGGAEFGYRFYSGDRGFNGLFVGPSLIVGRHKLTYADSGSNPPFNSAATERSVFFTGMGGAFDVGWQWQGEHFIIGGSVGIQYTHVLQDVRWVGRGAGLLIDYNSGGGLLPRLAFNVGYAF